MDSNDISRDAAEAEKEEMLAGAKASEASFVIKGAFRKRLAKACLKAIEQKDTFEIRCELCLFDTVSRKEGGTSVAEIMSDLQGEMMDLIRGDDPWTVQDLFDIESFHAKRLKDLLDIEAYILKSQK